MRTDVGSIAETDLAYTGQRAIESLGLLDYHARFFDASIGRFISPDSIVSDPANPQALNRYAYVNNSPLTYNDPTGHRIDDGCMTEGCSLTQAQANEDAQKLVMLQNDADKRKCDAGNDAYCSTALKHPVEVGAFTLAGLVTAGTVDYALAGGGLAGTTDWALWRAGAACLQSAVCRWVTSMAGGAGSTSLPARDLYYSQRGVSPSTKSGIPLDDLSQDIAQGWKGDPLRVLRIDDQLVSLDNRRLVVAKMLDINVPVTISEGYTLSDLVTQFSRDGIFSEITVRGTGMVVDMLGRIGGP